MFRPRTYVALIIIAATVLFFTFTFRREIYFQVHDYVVLNSENPPPQYALYHERERYLPQHNLLLPSPNGHHAKFLHFGNRLTGECGVPSQNSFSF